MIPLAGKVVIITGASSGVGEASARAFAKLGAESGRGRPFGGEAPAARA